MQTLESLYKVIGEGLASIAPENWSSVRAVAVVHQGHAKAGFGYEGVDGRTVWLDPDWDVSEAICDAFIDMHAITADSQSSRWNKVEFVLDRSGKFKIHYSYDEAEGEQ